MKVAGIIAEYDPFHKGHAAHIAATRAADGDGATHVVVVMSGSFTQRGEPALLSKFRRAEMALAEGADLVLELPLPFAMAPAENFAAGGVAILKALGCVDILSFGSECGDTAPLQRLAALSAAPEYRDALRDALAEGIPYAAAGQAAAARLLGEEAAAPLASPNNTLGLEYIRAAELQGADFGFFTLQRQGALHTDNAPKHGFAAATLLRKAVREGNVGYAAEFMPSKAFSLLQAAVTAGEATTEQHRLEAALLARLRQMTAEDFARLPWLSEGLENRLYKASRTAASYEALLTEIKTRRYPMARLRRILWAALLGMTTADTDGLPPYLRLLGMNARGREILSTATPTLPILTRTAQVSELDERAQRTFALECAATDLHALAMPQPLPCGTDHTQKLLVKD
ncbi:MAG: nucleotidyltransferase family protein [Clostridia bacterium]|nr:nucleotidyltransferase family protein [Clostridia bacterium]